MAGVKNKSGNPGVPKAGTGVGRKKKNEDEKLTNTITTIQLQQATKQRIRVLPKKFGSTYDEKLNCILDIMENNKNV